MDLVGGLPDLFLDAFVLLERLLGVLVHCFLLFVAPATVAPVGEEQPYDFGHGLGVLGLELLDCVVEGGVAGVGHLPVGVRALLEQQPDDFDLGLADGGDEEGLVAGFLVDLPAPCPTSCGSCSSSSRRICSESSLLLFSMA